MVEEIKKQFVGEWTHTQDDHLPPFFDAVGATDTEKQFMLTSTPQLILEVGSDNTIRMCDTPHPDTKPDIKADITFKLDQQFKFKPRGHCLQVTVSMEDGKMLQAISPLQGHTASYTVELSIGPHNELVQKYCTVDSSGNEVTGTRRYIRKSPNK